MGVGEAYSHLALQHETKEYVAMHNIKIRLDAFN